jgi:hypothetical protein
LVEGQRRMGERERVGRGAWAMGHGPGPIAHGKSSGDSGLGKHGMASQPCEGLTESVACLPRQGWGVHPDCIPEAEPRGGVSTMRDVWMPEGCVGARERMATPVSPRVPGRCRREISTRAPSEPWPVGGVSCDCRRGQGGEFTKGMHFCTPTSLSPVQTGSPHHCEQSSRYLQFGAQYRP